MPRILWPDGGGNPSASNCRGETNIFQYFEFLDLKYEINLRNGRDEVGDEYRSEIFASQRNR